LGDMRERGHFEDLDVDGRIIQGLSKIFEG
jgi:hypothetical protein